MKKLICLLAAVMMLLSAACAETVDLRKEFNPQNYSLIEVVDYWYDDYGDEHNVQGTFGDYTPELELMEGFDPEEIRALTLALDAEIRLPNADGEIVPVTVADLDAYIGATRATSELTSFFCVCSSRIAGGGTLCRSVAHLHSL